MVTLNDVLSAARRIENVAHRTPVVTSRLLDEACGNRMFLKCENLQRTGAFKFRGAYNTMSRLGEADKARGVVACSSGNHAQAVALVSALLHVRATLVMPCTASGPKLSATRGYGAEVVLYDPQKERRESIALDLAARQGLTVIPPFDHPHIIAGQGTSALELLQEATALDYLFIPCGGGGLLSGSAVAVKHLAPGCRIVGVEPAAGDDGVRSFSSGVLHAVHNPETIADGARTSSLGELTFPLIRQYVDEMLAVSDEDLVRAMQFVWTRLKLIVEPTGVLGLAAILSHRHAAAGKRIGVILSGGNVDLATALQWFQHLPAH
jgi:threo-3-hydroxy-L-aspartate ammonia-lyase